MSSPSPAAAMGPSTSPRERRRRSTRPSLPSRSRKRDEDTMDRREFLHAGVIATLATKVLGDTTLARAQAPAQGPAAAASVPAPRRLIMDAYTRHLHWIRSADEIAEAAVELTCGGVNPTIQAYPGHIDPAKVTTELPAFVKTMQKHGLRVKQVRGGGQTQVDATVEAMVGAMGAAG